MLNHLNVLEYYPDFFYWDYVLTYYLLFVEMIDWHLIVSFHPIRRLLVSINQSSYLIYFVRTFLAKLNQTNGNIYIYWDYVLTYYLLFVEMIDWHLIVSFHPIRRLLVSINQSSYLIYFVRTFLTKLNQTNGNIYIWNKIEETTFTEFDLLDILVFFFQKSVTLIEEDNPWKML